MKKSKKLKLKLITGSILILFWVMFGLVIIKIFDFHGTIWTIIFIIVFGFPFVVFITNSRWTFEEYTDLKIKEDFERNIKS